jgi:hypothetical protein
MLLKLMVCAALALVLAPAAASAQGRPLTESSSFTDSPPLTDDSSAEELMRACEGGRAGPSLACTRYLDGMLSMHALMVGFGARPQFCLPSGGIRLDEARQAFVDYMVAHPQALEQSARIDVVMALRAAFPCEEPPPRRRGRP